jgi:hypothetical protein
MPGPQGMVEASPSRLRLFDPQLRRQHVVFSADFYTVSLYGQHRFLCKSAQSGEKLNRPEIKH